MQREIVVRLLREAAALLELQGENPFRVRAYENASRAIEGLAEEPDELLEAGTLAEVRGIGPGLVASIAEILKTGQLALRDELAARYPPGLLDLFRVGGLGPKKIRALHQKLGVGSVAELEAACREGRVAELPGFGAKSQAAILESLATLKKYQERHLISDALPVAEHLLAHLRSHPRVAAAEIAGSLRRRRETIGDLDFVCAVAAGDREAVASHFEQARHVDRVLASGSTKVSVLLAGGFQADLRMVEVEELASAFHHFTGSKEHNVEIRSRAKRSGLTVNEYGVFRADERLVTSTEEELYGHLGLPWIPPELREGLGEIELAEAGRLPELLERADLRGTFHVHTTWSDGRASLDEMAKGAASLGWAYLGIADHSRAAAYAGGLSAEQVRAQWKAIDEWNGQGRAPHLFKGTECDILADGALDFDDDLLLGFDYVVASVHSRFNLPAEEMTRRIVKAVSHPCVTFLGHPTGRLLLAREAYDFDFDAVLDAAEANGVIVELNANPHRLDLDWRTLRGWLARGCRTSIHPDAHSVAGLRDVDWGVAIARKAGTTARQVLNTGTLDSVRSYFDSRRRRAQDLLAREDA